MNPAATEDSMLKLKIYALIILIIAAAVAASFFLPGIGNVFKPHPEPAVSVHILARRYLETAQMISLHCKYDDVFELSEDKLKNIYGMPIPGTGKRLIVKTRGTIFLGIDCKDIAVDTARSDTLFIIFPPIKIIAHEFEFTNIYDLSGVFRKYKMEDIPELRNNYKTDIEFNTKNDRAAISLAETAMENAFKNNIPTLKDVPIAFRWKAVPLENIPIDIKSETPVSRTWDVSESPRQ
jgi:hypothetical protein